MDKTKNKSDVIIADVKITYKEDNNIDLDKTKSNKTITELTVDPKNANIFNVNQHQPENYTIQPYISRGGATEISVIEDIIKKSIESLSFLQDVKIK